MKITIEAERLARMLGTDFEKEGFTQTVPVRYQHQENCVGNRETLRLHRGRAAEGGVRE